jgi:hypothetical protein
MRALSFVSAFLFVFIISRPSHAQGGQTNGPVGDTLTICNAGAVDATAAAAADAIA